MRALHLHLIPNRIFNKFFGLEKENGGIMVFESIFQIWEIRLITRSETTVLKTGKTRLFCFLSDLLFLAIVFWTLSRFIPSKAWKIPQHSWFYAFARRLSSSSHGLFLNKNSSISRTVWIFKNLAMSSK